MMPATFSCSSFLIRRLTSTVVLFLDRVAIVAGQIDRGIKRRQVNNSQAIGAAVAIGHFDQFGLGRLSPV